MYKTKIKKLIKRMLYPALLVKYKNEKIDMSFSEAMEILEDTSPKPTGTIEADNKLDIKYDLMIIIPAYNVEKYIKKCIDSVLNQDTKYSYEVVVVDDGSTDRTGKIVDEFSEYPSIRIIHQENRGFSGARNRALEIITGRYIIFLDSDDCLVDGAIDIMLDTAYKKRAEIVQGAWYDFVEDNQIIGTYFNNNKMDGKAVDILSGYPWGKIYDAKLFVKNKFPEGYWFEDTILSMVLYWDVVNAAATNQVVYAYRQNPCGITKSSVGNPKAIDTFWITALCLEKNCRDKEKLTLNMRKQFLNQIWMNYIRTKKLPRHIQEAVFRATVQLYLGSFSVSAENGLSKKEKKLNKLIKEMNYGKYQAMMSCWPDL